MIRQIFIAPSYDNTRKSFVGRFSKVKKVKLKYGKSPYKLADVIPWNKICVDLIVPYTICRKVKKKYLIVKSVPIIYPIMSFFLSYNITKTL